MQDSPVRIATFTGMAAVPTVMIGEQPLCISDAMNAGSLKMAVSEQNCRRIYCGRRACS